MRPLGIVLSWNRLAALQATIQSLAETSTPNEIKLVVVDNGSTDGSAEWLQRLDRNRWVVDLCPENIGCPRRFNYALEKYREPGQPVAKLDGDVRVVTKNWVSKMMQWEESRDVGIAVPWFWGAYDERVVGTHFDQLTGLCLHETDFVPGHFMWITGRAMDKLGYFDVLGPDHFYGYDDVLFVARCQKLGMLMGIDQRLDAHHIEHRAGLEPTLPDGMQQKAHAAWIRDRYVERLEKYRSGELDCYVGKDGGLGDALE